MEVDRDRLILLAQWAEVLYEDIQETPHSFRVNTLIGYLHHNLLEILQIDTPKKALENGLKIYVTEYGRFHAV